MDVTPLIRKGQKIIQSYRGGAFKISGVVYEHAVILTPDDVWKWKIGGGVQDLSEAHFSSLTKISDQIDVVLLGCGSHMAFLPLDLRKTLKEQGIQIDVMDTGAACRTYNVLMAEGRRVACALIPTK